MEMAGLFGGMFETVLEVVNGVLAAAVIALAVSLMRLMRGGVFAEVWKWIVYGIVFFAAGSVYSLLGHQAIFGAGMFDIHNILELLSIVSFLVALYKGRRAVV